jgi:hypothetical protein
MKYRTTLLAGLGVLLASGLAAMACTSPDRAYGVVTGSTSGTGGAGTGTGVGGGSTGTGMVMMSTGTGTTTTLPCTVPSDCPGKETECQTRTCDNSFCGIGFSAAGKAISAQFGGDCQQIVCDGQGTIVQQADDTDVPDDSNPCTKDVCTGGVPSHPAAPFGTTCGGALTCDNTGHCTGCTGPGDCPGADTDCQTRSCTGTVCGFIYQQAGTKVTMQTPADCKQNVCNGMGAVSVTFDSTDLQDDGNDCTLDGCSNGTPTHANLAAGATCAGSPPNTVCNGGGACVQCVTASTCPGQDDECKTRKCAAGACGFDFTAVGTPVALQTGGDCHKSVCDGNGGVTQMADDADVQNDGNPCTGDSCNGGSIVHAPVAMGTDCGAPKKCDATGNCAGCLGPTDCPGTDTECQSRTCSSGVCGLNFAPSGTPVAAQTPNDCKKNVCDGSGNTTVIADDSDVASDGVECTSDTCAGGAASYPPSPPGSTCSVGGTVCNGVGGCGVCTPGDSVSCNCIHKSFACCDNPIPNSSGSDVEKLASVSDGASDVPDFACCCIETKDCDGSGQWGLCY